MWCGGRWSSFWKGDRGVALPQTWWDAAARGPLCLPCASVAFSRSHQPLSCASAPSWQKIPSSFQPPSSKFSVVWYLADFTAKCQLSVI